MSVQSNKKYILAPFNENHHWILILLCLQSGLALFFNSLGGGLENVKVKGSLSMAYRTLKLNDGTRSSLDRTLVKCPRQPGAYECGYYVMVYIYEHFSLKPYSQ